MRPAKSEAVSELGLGDRREEHARGGLAAHPGLDRRRRRGTHQLGDDVGIQKDHGAKSGGSRIGSRDKVRISPLLEMRRGETHGLERAAV